MKFTIVMHYCKHDVDCMEDYTSVELLNEAGTVIVEYADAYHDKGREKIEGFLEGVQWLSGSTLEVARVDVADCEDC